MHTLGHDVCRTVTQLPLVAPPHETTYGCGSSVAYPPAEGQKPGKPPALGDRQTSSIVISTLTGLNFEQLMHDEKGVDLLVAFAKKEYSEENVLFWIDAKRFRELQGREAAALGASIIDRFLCADAEMMVNLPSQLSAPFRKSSARCSYKYSRKMFDKQAREIKRMVERDTFSRFKLTDEAMRLVTERPM